MDSKARLQALLTDRSFIVQAPAGSGKTELLTQRFLALLATVDEPEQILALTFTRKAAQEMAHRILKALHDAKLQTPLKNEHQKTTRLLAAKALSQSEQGNWQLLEHPQRLRIKTFDGFCMEIYQAIPKEESATLSHLEIDPKSLYQKAVQKWFQYCRENASCHEALKILIRQENNQLQVLFKKLSDSLYTRDQWLGALVSQRQQTPEQHQEILSKLADYHWQGLSDTLPPNMQVALFDLVRQYHAYVPEGFPELKNLTSLENLDNPSLQALRQLLLTSSQSLRKCFDHHVGVKQKKPAIEAYVLLKEASEAFLTDCYAHPDFIEKLISLCEIPHPKDIHIDWDLLQAYYQLLPLLAAYLQIEFEEQESMDYIYVANQALHALQTTEMHLYFDEKLHHLLIDEFQDTSALQLRLIEELTENWSQEPHKSIFLVGDPMQSIYRFRSAQVGIFLKAQREGIHQIQLTNLYLSQNFRSNANLIEHFNTEFTKIFPEEEKIELGAVRFHPAHPTKASDEECFVKSQFYENSHEQSQAIIEIIQEAEKQKDIRLAILVRSRSKLPEILNQLRQQHKGYSGVDLFPLGERLYIRDLWNLTQLFLEPGQRVHELAVLASPLCGLTLQELEAIANPHPKGSLLDKLYQQLDTLSPRLQFFLQTYQQIWQERDQMPLYEWVEKMASKLSFFKTLQEFEQKEVLLFFEILEHACAKQVFPSTKDIQEKLKQTFVSSFHGTQIQVMTIHKSKGLEFDWVILPDMGTRTRNAEQTLFCTFHHPQTGLVFVLPNQKQPYLNILNAFNQKQDAYEAQRLCYVAFTRAKKRLYCLDAQATAQKNSFRALFPAQAFQKGQITQTKHSPEKSFQTFVKRIPESQYIQMTSKETLERHQGTPFENHLWEKLLGTAAHRILQWVCEFHPQSPDDIPWILALQQFKKEGFSEKDTQKAMVQIQQWILPSLKHPIGQWITSAHTFEKNEFELLYQDKHIVRHMVIDRLFIDANCLWIIDFKTKNHKAEYRTQLERYAKAIQPLYPEYPIQCGLFYIATQEFIPWKAAQKETIPF